MADRIIQMKDNQGNNLFPLVKISPSILEGNYLPITGGILTGDLILKGDPTSLLMPATKQYVDNGFATKQYVDNGFLRLTGGKINVNSGSIFSANFSNDIFGFNPSYGVYIGGSNLGGTEKGTYYLYSGIDGHACPNASINGSRVDLLHTGNYNSYALPLTGGTVTGHVVFGGGSYVDNVGSLYYSGGIEIREKGLCGASQSDIGYGPTLGFHWGYRVASSFTLGSDHILYYYNNNGALGTLKAGSIYGAVWNDYAEYRKSDDNEPGRVVMEDKKGVLQRATERLQSFAGVVSDTFGFSEGETDEAKTPLAVAGRVLVYPYRPREEYNPGDCVCAAPDGTVDIMTRQEIRDWPDRIVGTVSEIPDYETWGTGNVEVNGRIWIKVR